MTKVAFSLAPDPDPEAAEAGRKLFAGPLDFVRGVVEMSGLPEADRVEVCFAGRSNAGKSSLINALAGRKSAARVSNTPGRTREINYFALGAERYLVDLPGYGYAKAPKAAVAQWQELTRRYLAGRSTLRRVFVLVDARHGVKPPDAQIMDLLDSAAVTFQCVLTKGDKVSAASRGPMLEQVRGSLAAHPAAYPEMVLTSSRSGEGLAALRAAVAALE